MILKLKMENGETLREAFTKAIEIAKKLNVKVSFIDNSGHFFVADKNSSTEELMSWYTKEVETAYFKEIR